MKFSTRAALKKWREEESKQDWVYPWDEEDRRRMKRSRGGEGIRGESEGKRSCPTPTIPSDSFFLLDEVVKIFDFWQRIMEICGLVGDIDFVLTISWIRELIIIEEKQKS